MDNLNIDTGVKRLMINSDPTRVLEFNPSDVLFAEKFYSLIGEFQSKQVEYSARSKELADQGQDENGVPVNLPGSLALMHEACEFMRGRIDWLFGPGTSQIVFGDALNLDMFAAFFEGITPFIKAARAGKVNKYAAPTHGKVMR